MILDMGPCSSLTNSLSRGNVISTTRDRAEAEARVRGGWKKFRESIFFLTMRGFPCT